MRFVGHRVPGQRSGGPLALSVVLNSSNERLLAVLAGKHASGRCGKDVEGAEATTPVARLLSSLSRTRRRGAQAATMKGMGGSRARQGLFPKRPWWSRVPGQWRALDRHTDIAIYCFGLSAGEKAFEVPT